MGDYISRDMAIARLTKVEVTNSLATMTDAKREIAEMPAADVAPVVLCKYCRTGWYYCEYGGTITPQDYCSRAELITNVGAPEGVKREEAKRNEKSD